MTHYLIDEQEPKHIKKLFQMEGAVPVNSVKGEYKGDTYEVVTLETGDIVVEEVSLGVERKSVDDFWQSVKDGRLEKQCLRMLDTFDHCFVMISSRSGGLRRLEQFKWKGRTAVRPALGMIASVVSRYVKKDSDGNVIKRIQVLSGITDKMLVVLTMRIAEKLKKHPISVRRVRHKSTTLEEAPLRMLMGIPGMSTKSAKNVLARFGSIESILEASEDELKSVDKVGDIKASYIYDALRLVYEVRTPKKS